MDLTDPARTQQVKHRLQVRILLFFTYFTEPSAHATRIPRGHPNHPVKRQVTQGATGRKNQEAQKQHQQVLRD